MTFKKKINVYKSPKAAALWSIALPGLGQVYNRDYIVGFILLIGEVIINVMSNLNLAIFYAFTGNVQQSFQVIDFQWGLFYPSLYAYSIWSAYNRANEINFQLKNDNIAPPNETISKYTGLFFGFLIGMHSGIYWMNYVSPIFGGLLVGFGGAILGHQIEKFYVNRKGYKRSEL
ncbi:hypothetical protein RJD24_10215 [Bacillaceae bacterium IKA-2]|nr:hypothetical protein RJD24_10215 [Bacillaceae bacterium IKA-2]